MHPTAVVRAGGITHRTPKRTFYFYHTTRHLPSKHASKQSKQSKQSKIEDINILPSSHNLKDMLRTPARAKIRGTRMRAAGKSYGEIKKLTDLERSIT
jgi:hypothetical protein